MYTRQLATGLRRHAKSVQAIVAKVLNERPTPLSMLRDPVPAGVERAVLTALAKLPAARHASAAAFIVALGEDVRASGAPACTTAPGGGGSEPRRARSGRELFFESAGRLASVLVGAGTDLDVSEPKPLFPLGGYRRARNRPQYDVAPGDQRFLMIKEPPVPPIPTVIHVEHWFPELLAKVKP